MLLDEIKNIQSSKQDLKKFGVTVGIALIILGCFLLWLEKDTYPYFLISGPVLIISGLFAPQLLKPIQITWMAIATILGWFMTRVILSILYYLIFTSIGLLAKLFGKRFLDIKIDKSQESYWNYRNSKSINKSDYERQF